jgi:peptidyl-prolyl cis-trans isomerase C
MMHTQRISLALVAAVGLLTACTRPEGDAAKTGTDAAAAAKTTVVATVNGTKITSQVFDVFLQAVTGKPAAEAAPEQKAQMLDQLINMTLAAQAAEKEGTLKDPAVQAKVELIRTQILAEAATEKYMKSHPVSESELKAEYDSQVASMPKEYKARHILVETKEEAESIIRELGAGGDFAKIAASESKDSSGKNGGDLGWFSPQSMVKPFADAVMALEKGQTTQQPVQSEFGWHVINLEDVRSPEPPAFDDVKQQVEMLAQRKKLQAYLDELRKTATVQKTD